MDDKDVAERLDSDPELSDIRKFFVEKFSISSDSKPKTKVIEDLTFDGLTAHWKKNGFKKIITMVGAGISTSAGIPDFRSPGSGLYDNLQKYNLPHPTSIFDMDYFLENPRPFFALAKELYPGKFNPTPAHYFVRLLASKGVLVRHYTQNIDTLERVAGIPENKLVEAHGTFYTNHCLGCKKAYSMEWVKEKIFADKVPKCTVCKSVVKPDIVFFGENMPESFFKLPRKDFKDCDLLIIMGTSLEVQPFASLIDKAGPNCMRLLINRDKVGVEKSWFSLGPGLKLDQEDNTRDVAYIGNCDDGVYALADALGWGDELKELVKSEHSRLETENTTSDGSKDEPKKTGKKESEESSSSEATSEGESNSKLQLDAK